MANALSGGVTSWAAWCWARVYLCQSEARRGIMPKPLIERPTNFGQPLPRGKGRAARYLT